MAPAAELPTAGVRSLDQRLPRAVFYLIVATAVMSACIWALGAAWKGASSGLEVDASCQIRHVHPGGPGGRAGLRVGDRILSIDGVLVSRAYELLPVTQGRPPGSRLSLEIRRGGVTLAASLDLTTSPFPVWATAALAAYAVLWIQAFVLFVNRSRERIFRLYVWMVPAAMLWSVTRLLVSEMLFAPLPSTVRFADLFYLAFLFLPVAAHFVYVFTGEPRLLSLGRRAWLGFVYGPVGVLVAILLALPSPGSAWTDLESSGGPAAFSVLSGIGPVAEILVVGAASLNGFLGAFIVLLLIRTYLLAESAELRSQVKLVLLGIFALILIAALANIVLLVAVQNAEGGLLGLFDALRGFGLSLGLACVLLLVSLALVRFHLNRVDPLVSQTIVYGATTGTLLLLFVGLVYSGTFVFGKAGGEGSDLWTLGAALLLVLLLEPAKRRIQLMVDRVFFRDKGALGHVPSKMLRHRFRSRPLDALLSDLGAFLEKETPIERAFVLPVAPGGQEQGIGTALPQAVGMGADLGDLAGSLDLLAGRLVAPVSRQMAAESRSSRVGSLAELEPLFQSLGVEVLSPVSCDGRFLGILGLGQKRSRSLYAPEDLEAVGDVARQMGILVHRAILEDEIESLQDSLVRQAEIIEDQGKQLSSLERRLTSGEARRAISGARGREHACPPVDLIGKDPAFQKIMSAVKDIAPTRSVVLILGETGTGKDLVARALHLASPRRDDPFVVVNCTAIPEGLLESELFGHEKGAFTGAHEQRIGKFELADGGTLFLNEIGDLPLSMQAKLLRAIEYGECERVGGTGTLHVDVRIIAATHRNLEEGVREGSFRQDLYYRLKVVPIRVPPLRERSADIPLLARHFLAKYSKRMNRQIRDLDEATLGWMMRYDWPGNVREMEHLIERGVVLATSDVPLLPPMAPQSARADDEIESAPWDGIPEEGMPLAEAMRELKRRLVLKALEGAGWNKAQAAKILGVQRPNLYRLMEQLGIEDRPPPV